MGAYCHLEKMPSHTVSVGEIMEVRWSDYHGAIIFGDREEVACIPHAGCRLEIVATPPSSPRKVNLLLPGQVIRYTHSFFLGDRVGPGQHAAGVVDVQVLHQAAVDHINASQVLGYRDDRLLEPPRRHTHRR